MKYRIFAAAFIAGLAVALVAGTTDKPDHKYLEYASGFATYTGKLLVPCDDRTAEATATLIGDHWALTAAHVTGTATTARLVVNGRTYAIDRIVTHPEFAGVDFGRNDIAVLHSPVSFGLDFYPPLSDGSEAVGDVVSVCGYGVCGSMATGHDTADGRLRAGTNTIERIEEHLIICTASPGGSPLEFCISPGDSGGPLFCRGRLAGVNCLTMADKGPLLSRTGEESGHVRVWPHREWIEGVTHE